MAATTRRRARATSALASASLLLGGLAIGAVTASVVDAQSPSPTVTGAFTSVCPVAGNGTPWGADPALRRVNSPKELAVDDAGNVYFHDSGNDFADNGARGAILRRVDAVTGAVTLVAGAGPLANRDVDGIAAVDAWLAEPRGLTVTPDGSALYFVESARVRRIDLVSGLVTTVAGVRNDISIGADAGPALTVPLGDATDVVVNGTDLFVLSFGSNADPVTRAGRIFRVDLLTGTTTKVAGTTFDVAAFQEGQAALQTPRSATNVFWNAKANLGLDRATGDLYFSGAFGSLFRYRPSDVAVQWVAGAGFNGSRVSGVNALTANILGSSSYAVRGNQLFVAELTGSRISTIDLTTNVVTTFYEPGLGVGFGGDGQAIGGQTRFSTPFDIAVDAAGNLFVSDTLNHRIRRVSVAGVVSTVAGAADNPLLGAAFGNEAEPTSLQTISGVASDDAGGVYVADSLANRIYYVDPNGHMGPFAGTGRRRLAVLGPVFPFEGTPAAAYSLGGELNNAGEGGLGRVRFASTPAGRFLYAFEASNGDGSGRLVRFSVDDTVHAVEEVIGQDGIGEVTSGTLATTQPGYFTDFAVAPNGDVFVAARRQGWVYRIDAGTGVVTNFAGTGSLTPFDPQAAGGDRLALSLGLVTALDVDTAGRLYLVASGTVVLRIDPATGVVEHLAGGPNPGGSIGGTGGPALAATVVASSIKVDAGGRVFLAEGNAVRAFTPGGSIERVAGGVALDDIEHTASGVARSVDDARIGVAAQLDIAIDGSLVFVDHSFTSIDLQIPGGLPVNRAGSHRVRALRVGGCDRALPLAPATTANAQMISGALAGTARVYEVAATDDLRYIAFSADGTPSLGGRQGQINVYLYDRFTGRRQLVNIGGDGQPDNRGLPPADPSVDIAIRDQRPVVAFPSNATNLTAGGANELYVRYLETGVTAPVLNSGSLINGPQVSPSLSPDGRLLLFRNLASPLDPQPRLLYMADVGNLTAAVRPIGRAVGGGPANGVFDNARLSDDSRYAVYQTAATNLGLPSGGIAQIVREDLTDGSKELVSVDVFGNAGTDNSDDPYISADGRYVAFVSNSTNLGAVPQSSPLVRDMVTGVTTNLLELPGATAVTGRVRAMSPDGMRFLLDVVQTGSRRAVILDRASATPSFTALEPVRNSPLESLNGPAPFAFQSSGVIDAGGRRAVFVSHHGITTTASKEIPQLFLVDSHRVDPAGPYTSGQQLVRLASIGSRIVRRQPDGSVLAVDGSLTLLTATTQTTIVASRFAGPTGMVVAPDGRIFIGDSQGAWRVGTDGSVTQLLSAPAPVEGIALAPDGAVAVSLRDGTVARVNADGSRTVIAGRSFFPACGPNDGDLATNTGFCRTGPIAYDAAGNLYIADSGYDTPTRPSINPNGCISLIECSDRIRRVDARSGRVSTVAGIVGPAALARGYDEDGVAAVSTRLGYVADLVVGTDGSLLIAQPEEHRIRRVDPAGVITTVVGNGGQGAPAGSGPALGPLGSPWSADAGASGELAVSTVSGAVYEVAGLDVTLSVSAAVSRPGVAAAPTAAIPAVAIDPPPAETAITTLGATGLGQLGDDALAAGLQASPLRTIPLRTIPLRTIAMSASPLRTIPLRTIPLRTIPLLLPGGWEEALKGTSLEGVPIDALTLADAFGPANTNLETHNPRDLLDQPLSVLDLSATPLRTIALAAVALGALPLRTIPLATPATANDAAWCQIVQLALGQTCAQAAIDPATDSLFAINLAGVPLRTIPLRTIPLRTIMLADAPLRTIPLRTIPLRTINLDASPLRTIPLRTIPLRTITTTAAPLRTIPLRTIPLRTIELDASPLRTIPLRTIANVATLVDCSKVDCTATGSTLATAADADAILATASVGALTEALPASVLDQFQIGDLRIYGDATIEDLLDLLPTEPEYTLDDLLKALVPLTDYPWETLDLGETAELRAAATTLPNGDPATPPAPVTYTVDVVRGTSAVDMAVDVDIVPPFGFRFVPGSAKRRRAADVLTLPVPTVTSSGLRFRVAGLKQADQLTFDFVPGLELGARQTSVTVSGVNVPLTKTATLATSVAGEWEEPNDALATARPISADTIYLGHIATGADVDVYKLTVQEGQSLSIILSNLAADLDLTLYAPLAPLVSTRATERVLVPVADEGLPLDGQPVAAPADVANDIPLDSGVAVYTVAQRRGTADERIDTGRLHAGTYYLKVTGFNGAATTKAYALRAAVLAAAPGLPACSAWTYATATAERGVLPTTAALAGVDTLFLVNRERLFGRFGSAEGARVLAALDSFVTAAATHPAWGVRAAVAPVDGDDAVHTANLAWDSVEGRCDPARARALSAAIASRVDQIRAAVPTITNVVIIGGDDLVPFGRVPDTTKLANEREYESQIAGVNEISSAMRGGWMLTDDVYVDARPVQVGSSELSVPTATVGRLVESPSDIVTALADFVTNDGHLDARTALSVGYDFLADGASAVRDALVVNGLVADAGATDLIGDTWTAARLRQALLGSTSVPDIASVNAHYDHFRALPADQNLSGLQTDLFDLSDVTNSGARTLARSLLFSMGCHSGLSVADDSVAGFKADWAQTYSAEGAVWLGNTGFGYGDTEVVAASEKLMLLFARQLDGSLTAGQALLAAKQRYVGDLGETMTPYDLKVSQEMTYYGLPMYRLRATAAPLDPVPAPPATAVDVRTQLDTASLTIAASLTQTIGDRGTYWTVAGDALTVQNRPIQPRTTVDVTRVDAAGTAVADARGMLVTSLVSSDRQADPVVFRPIIDSSEETEPDTVENVFPAAPVSIGRYADLVTVNGAPKLIDRQQVVAIPGQFQSTGTTGIQRLYSSIGGLVYYASPTDTDLTAPTIRHVAAAVNGGGASFTVTTDDEGDAARVRRVFVLAVPSGAPLGTTSVWIGADLVRTAPASATWSGGVVVPAGTTSVDYIVQVVDGSGNVAISSNKGVNYTTATAPTTDPQAPVVTTSPAVDAGTWSPTAVTVTASDPQSATMAYRVDGGAFQPYVAPFAVSGSGVHEIVVRNAVGRSTTVSVPIDTEPPVGTCAAAPAGWSATPVSVSCVAADGASGLANAADASFALVAPAPANTETAAAVTGTRQVCDRVNRCATVGPVTGIRIDTRGPAVTVTAPAANASYTVGQVVNASYSCADGGSGLASCTGTVANGTALDTATAGSKSFTVTGRDVLGNTTVRTVAYTVRAANTAPAVRADLGITGLEDVGFLTNAVALTGSFTDAEGNGPFRAEVQWQAGAAFVPFVLTSGNQLVAAFVYGSAGTRVVTVRVCDAANACGTDTVTVRTTITQRVTPVLECVRDRGASVSPRYLARFGYDNPASFFVALAGTSNAFSPTPALRGQPLVFRPGRQQFVFDVAFNGSNLTWNLNGRSVTANTSSRRCTA